MQGMDKKGWARVLALAFVISAVTSVAVAAVILRACLGTGFKFYLSPGRAICGETTGSGQESFKRLTADEMSVMSVIPEREDLSIGQNRGADKLIDGSDKTLAAPGSEMLEYLVLLLEPKEIKQMTVHWGDYGINDNYIAEWSIESSDDGEEWEVVASGASPKDSRTVVNETIRTSRLRLKARSAKDWIGIYELEIIARPFP